MLFYVWVRIHTGQHPRNKIAGLKDYCICNFDGSCDMALLSSYASLLSQQQHMRGSFHPVSLPQLAPLKSSPLHSNPHGLLLSLAQKRWADSPAGAQWARMRVRWGPVQPFTVSRALPSCGRWSLGANSQCDFTPSSQHHVFQRTALSQHLWRGKCLEKYILPRGTYFLRSLMSTGE